MATTDRLRIALAAGLVAVCAHAVIGQQPTPTPTFRSQVDLVELDAIVTDSQGNIVTDLTAEDFVVLEDGTPQPVATFSLVNIPIERAERPLYSPTAIEPDVQRNDGPDGRLYVIALDEVAPLQVLRTRIFLRRFIEGSFGTNDRAAIVLTGRGRASDSQDFTANRRLLLNAIDKFSGGFSAEAPPPAGPGGGLPRGLATEAEFSARTRLASLRHLTEFMATLRGRRKALLFVSEGVGINMFSVIDNPGAAMSVAGEDARAAVRAATRGNVTIYTIDPRGLTPDGGTGENEAPPTEEQRTAGRDSREGLRALADVTGGFAFVNQNDFSTAFDRIVRENSTYYILGFYSTNEKRDGRYRRLQVRVNRPGLQVRSRAGYLAPAGRPPAPTPANAASKLSPAVGDALRSPLAVSALPMRMSAAPYKASVRDAAIAIAVELDVAALDLVDKDGTFGGRLEVTSAATSAAGKIYPGERHDVALALKADTHEKAKRAGVRVLLEPVLPPGRYQVRVAAGVPGGRAGSVVYDLDVPDFRKGPLVMSGVSLTSVAANDALTIRSKDPLRGLLPGAITATREFTPSDTLTLFAEVYENVRGGASHTLDLKAELRADDGRIIRTKTEQRSSTELQGVAGGYGFMAEIPLDGLSAGIYVIHVEARANIGERATVSRDILIRIR